MRRSRLALTACLLACAVPPGAARAQDDDALGIDGIPHITALGVAVATVKPDVARLTIGVATQKPTASEAEKENNASAQHLVEAAEAAGVAAGDLTTTAITLSEVNASARQADGSFKPERQGFRATYLVAIDVRDFAKVGTLVQALVDGGANQFNGVSFRVEHPEAARERLAADAMRDARHQAGVLADAAGVRLGRLLQVERPDQPAGARTFAFNQGDLDVPFAPGPQTLSQAVEATYAIEP